MTDRQISLIPSGQPYGRRQETEQAFSEAGIAQTVSDQPPAPQPITPASPFDGGLDALALRQPEPGFALREDPESRMLGLLDSSPSPLLRDLARRIRRA